MQTLMLFVRGYLPGEKYGGPTTSIFNFTELLGEDYDLRIVCQDHDMGSDERYPGISNGWNRIGKAYVYYISKRKHNIRFIKMLIKKYNPSLIYASSVMELDFNFAMFMAAKALKIPIILVPRADLCDWSIQLKAWKKLPFLWLMKHINFFNRMYFQSTIEEETENITKYLGVDRKKIFGIQNIPMPPVRRDGYRKEKGRLSIIFISRIHKQKNLPYAIKVVKKLKCYTRFDIYGPIEEKEQWEFCMEEMKESPINVTIEYKGALAPREAKVAYSKYDCLLFPTLCENYGHVIAEALSNNLPIIISKGTTPWDDVNENGGMAVDLANKELFVHELEKIADMDDNDYQVLLNKVYNYALKKMNFEELKQEYVSMFDTVIQNWSVRHR